MVPVLVARAHVQHMLDVVVIGVTLVKAGILALVEAREVGEGLGEVARGILLVKILVDAADCLGHDLRIGCIDPVGDVVIVASIRFGCHPAPEKLRKSFEKFMRVLDYNEMVRATRDNTRKPNMFPGQCAILHARLERVQASAAHALR
jgi:hypothetical protein